MLKAEQLPEVSWDFVYGTNMQHAFLLSRQLLARQTGTKQIIMITDGEPTAHIEGAARCSSTTRRCPETVEATLREVARCTRDGIRINTFMLDANSYLKAFVERLTAMNRGRAFFTTPETLGDYVLVDFIEQKRQQAGGADGPADRHRARSEHARSDRLESPDWSGGRRGGPLGGRRRGLRRPVPSQPAAAARDGDRADRFAGAGRGGRAGRLRLTFDHYGRLEDRPRPCAAPSSGLRVAQADPDDPTG